MSSTQKQFQTPSIYTQITGGTSDQVMHLSSLLHLADAGHAVGWGYQSVGTPRRWELDRIGYPEEYTELLNSAPKPLLKMFSQKSDATHPDLLSSITSMSFGEKGIRLIHNIIGKTVLMVRRTDFLKDKSKLGYDVEDYQKMVEGVDRGDLLITSDDEGWCIENLQDLGSILPTGGFSGISLIGAVAYADKVLGQPDSGFFRLTAEVLAHRSENLLTAYAR